jgi:hypothetical protein
MQPSVRNGCDTCVRNKNLLPLAHCTISTQLTFQISSSIPAIRIDPAHLQQLHTQMPETSCNQEAPNNDPGIDTQPETTMDETGIV